MSFSNLTFPFKNLYRRFVYGYWFVPSMMCLGAVILFVFSIKIDNSYDLRGILNDSGIYWLNLQADGARAFLASISGALITVLGVVFSLTLLLISHVSSQFSPRVLANFMEHNSIKFTLGILISTFLFNVLALFSIRSSGDNSPGFISETSLFIALLLTAICVFSLIHFFNHIPQSIRLCNILKEIGQNFAKDVKKLISKNKLTDLHLKQEVLAKEAATLANSVSIKATKSGYLNEFLDGEIKQLAEKNKCFIEFRNYLGDYIHNGSTIVNLHSEDPLSIQLDEFTDQINSCMSLSTEKQSRSDITYQADQMIEIAAKALSPGINDPHSANSALDWLFDGIFLLLNKNLRETRFETDKNGNLLFSMPSLNKEKLTKYIIIKSIPYFSSDPNSAIYMFTKLNLLNEVLPESETKDFTLSCSHQMANTLKNSHMMTDFSETESHDEEFFYKANLNVNYSEKFQK